MRKILQNGGRAVILAVLLVLFMAAGAAGEERTDASGKWHYTVEGDGAVLTGFVKEPKGKLTIPGELDGYTVTVIGEWAFNYVTGLTSVIIPDSVTRIGDCAFKECTRLTSVMIGNGVTHIDAFAFFECQSLKKVTIPGKVKFIGESAFLQCNSLTSVTLPTSVKYIGEDAFHRYNDAWTDIELNDRINFRVKKGSYAEQYVQRGCNTYPPPHEASELLPLSQYAMKMTIVNKATVNIRNGPGAEYAQIGEAYPGANFYYTGVTQNGFHEIVYPGIKVNPEYGYEDEFIYDTLYRAAFVSESLGTLSPIVPGDVLLSTPVGRLAVQTGVRIYYDEQLSKKSNGMVGDPSQVPFSGILPNGAYAVLYNRDNDYREHILWTGYIADEDVDDTFGLDD